MDSRRRAPCSRRSWAGSPSAQPPAAATVHRWSRVARSGSTESSSSRSAMLALALPFELAALSPLLASAYADGAGGATFASLRIVVQSPAPVHSGGRHGRDVPGSLPMVHPQRASRRTRRRRHVCRQHHRRGSRGPRRGIRAPSRARPDGRDVGRRPAEPRGGGRRVADFRPIEITRATVSRSEGPGFSAGQSRASAAPAKAGALDEVLKATIEAHQP